MSQLRLFANQELTLPVAMLLAAFESTGQTSFTCPTEPGSVILLEPATQKATFLERTAENQSTPAAGFWGWQNGVLFLGNPAPTGHYVLCYSAGKILFYLDTYTLSGRRQFIVKSPFDTDRTKIETLYLQIPAGYGTVTVTALSLEAAYLPNPKSSLDLSLDGINWTDSLTFVNKTNSAVVQRFYARLSLPQSEQSGSFKVATIVLRTKGFRTSFSVPSNVVQVATISSRSSNYIYYASFPNDDGTITVYGRTQAGAGNVPIAYTIDPYNRTIKPAPIRFTEFVSHLEADPVTLSEVHRRLRQVASWFVWDNLPYLLDRFYAYDQANKILLARLSGNDVAINVETGNITPLPARPVLLLPKYLVTQTRLLSYPQLQTLNTISLDLSGSYLFSAAFGSLTGIYSYHNGWHGGGSSYRVTVNPSTNTISTTYMGSCYSVSNKTLCVSPDKTFYVLDTTSGLVIGQGSNFQTVRTISGTAYHVDMNIDCSYLVTINPYGAATLYRIDY